MAGKTQKSSDNFKNEDKICPILDNPEPDCHCFAMTSQKIPYVVKYCMRYFKACEIYQRVLRKRRI
jgi:hypothetical protein